MPSTDYTKETINSTDFRLTALAVAGLYDSSTDDYDGTDLASTARNLTYDGYLASELEVQSTDHTADSINSTNFSAASINSTDFTPVSVSSTDYS